ncbi:hypothetical protein IV203_014350 [Nitzschia inconspicua]|uniref:Uncharacterized protein n=1 Tax=Nitzschia inconspicua TaxID=303405 RepID=A0A9K3KB95_9STRA|nr:hypothetical protein IV203_024987 [Nitzschia inconspicua]KAG7339946.1 hypothetical protein IV203_024996 [Nitzschia inconspicua]KAG7357730.1 hypothetical protein IV203_014317 [Nitzschia inconspicua]KAG7357739.1 hypothetical protein IV203_014326 [Nitzschia inconspicua]KAG7357750.1 hypothetical protein IV203_014337 [Nitzschia inconspicua]
MIDVVVKIAEPAAVINSLRLKLSTKRGMRMRKSSFQGIRKTARGTLLWDGRSAHQTLLAENVKTGTTEGLSPMQVIQLRLSVHGQYPLDVFRNHLYKEISKQSQGVYWQQKRNKKETAASYLE